MYPPWRLRPLSEEEARVIPKRARSQTASARRVRRAQIIHRASQGKLIAEIAAELDGSPNGVRKWFKRFGAQGLAG
jgi:hypothetical protein